MGIIWINKVRSLKADLTEKPFLAVLTLLIVLAISTVNLITIFPAFSSMASSPIFPIIRNIHDLLAIVVVLLVAYHWRPRIGYLLVFGFMAVNIPLASLNLTNETAEEIRLSLTNIIGASFIGFLGVWLIDRLRKTEDTLKESDQMFCDIINISPIGMYITQNNKVIYVNNQFLRNTGYNEDEVFAIDPFNLIVDEDRVVVRHKVENMLKGLDFTPYKYRYITKNGETRWVMETISRIVYKGNRAYLGNFMDITDLQIAETKIKEHMQRLQTLYKVSQAVSQTMELEKVASIALEAALSELRLHAGTIRCVDEKSRELVLLTDRGLTPELKKEMQENPGIKIGAGLVGMVAQSGEPLVAQNMSQSSDMVYKATAYSGFQSYIGIPLKAHGKTVGVMSTLSHHERTVTEKDFELLSSLGNLLGIAISNARLFKQVEIRGKEWEATFNSMREGVAILNHEQVIIRANKSLAKMLNTTPIDLIGKRCYEVIHKLESPLDECPFANCASTKQACTLLRQEQHLGNRWLNMFLDPVVDPESNLQGLVHVFNDVTELKKIEEEIQNRNLELSQLYQKETTMREEIENKNTELGHRVRELTALNKLFHQHLNLRFKDETFLQEFEESIRRLAEESNQLLRQVELFSLHASKETGKED